MATWMIRSGRGAEYLSDFLETNTVAIGWSEIGDIPAGSTRDAVSQQLFDQDYAAGNRYKIGAAAGQVWRFLNEVQISDRVVTYDPSRRVYHLGTIVSEPAWRPDRIELLPRSRSVKWDAEVPRDNLSASSRNSLGAISTIFMLPEDVAAELETGGEARPEPPRPGESTPEDETQPPEELYESTRAAGLEFIKDKISKLDPEEFERLVAGLLRAMGYQTRVSPTGPDRGVDILASPDGLGFEQPRIVVECKHRTRTSIGAPDIRSFIGGRHPEDKGLYVSTGGFTKDARYEAERASIPLTLMDFDQLVESIVQHYEAFDSESRSMLNLGRIYWPIG